MISISNKTSKEINCPHLLHNTDLSWSKDISANQNVYLKYLIIEFSFHSATWLWFFIGLLRISLELFYYILQYMQEEVCFWHVCPSFLMSWYLVNPINHFYITQSKNYVGYLFISLSQRTMWAIFLYHSVKELCGLSFYITQSKNYVGYLFISPSQRTMWAIFCLS